jgi:hypothetical protein
MMGTNWKRSGAQIDSFSTYLHKNTKHQQNVYVLSLFGVAG